MTSEEHCLLSDVWYASRPSPRVFLALSETPLATITMSPQVKAAKEESGVYMLAGLSSGDFESR